MNPMSVLGGGMTGGLSSSSSASGQSGPASGGSSGTGTKNISFGGGNPNTVGGFFSNPLVIVGIVAAVYFVAQRKK